MAFQHETRRAGDAAGPLELSCGEADNYRVARNHLAAQARSAALSRHSIDGALP